jgi:hypothetical protein
MIIETTELKFTATPEKGEVTAILDRRDSARAVLLLGHGSGSPIYHPVSVATSNAIAERGIATFRYNYPYSEGGARPGAIDPLPVLLDTFKSAFMAVKHEVPDLPLFVGGRSMSSQVISYAATQGMLPDALGLVLFVYPLNWERIFDDPSGHLNQVSGPVLFIQGDRDDLTDLADLRPVIDGMGDRTTLHVVEGSEHWFQPGEGSSRSAESIMTEVADVAVGWIDEVLAFSEL